MKKIAGILSGLLLLQGIIFPQSIIKVNQVGYLTGFSKYAWVNDLPGVAITWHVKNAADHRIVFSATTAV